MVCVCKIINGYYFILNIDKYVNSFNKNKGIVARISILGKFLKGRWSICVGKQSVTNRTVMLMEKTLGRKR